jgi:hypothetical protein
MGVLGRAERRAGPLGQFARGQRPVRRDDASAGRGPPGFARIEPRALGRQGADDQARRLLPRRDPAMGAPHPRPPRRAAGPGRSVPGRQRRGRPAGGQILAAPAHKDRRPRPHRSAGEEAPPDFFGLGHHQSGTRQRLLVRSILRDRRFDRPRGPVGVRPGLPGGCRPAAPPDLVRGTEDPVGGDAAPRIRRSRRLFLGRPPERGG